MRNRLQLQLILLSLLVAVCAAQTKKREIIYNILGEGQKILGKMGAEYTAISSQECAARCLADEECLGYKYQHKGTGKGNCFLIHCTETDRQTFESDENGETYTKVMKGESSIEPVSWSLPDPTLYWSFDNADGLIFMEGPTEMDSVPLVSGKGFPYRCLHHSGICGAAGGTISLYVKLIDCSCYLEADVAYEVVNYALTLDQTRRQWVDLGIHTEACNCTGGLIASRALGPRVSSSGFQIYCADTNFPFIVELLDGRFNTAPSRPAGWTHIVLNYIGPNNGEGITIYYDGTEVAKTEWVYPAADGSIVVGRSYTNTDDLYGSVQVDELLFFNRSLTPEEINVLAT